MKPNINTKLRENFHQIPAFRMGGQKAKQKALISLKFAVTLLGPLSLQAFSLFICKPNNVMASFDQT